MKISAIKQTGDRTFEIPDVFNCVLRHTDPMGDKKETACLLDPTLNTPCPDYKNVPTDCLLRKGITLTIRS